tara:strand:- start:90 stop:443 length:354 start_codon:yes stop_codon:yes gene_type:complete
MNVEEYRRMFNQATLNEMHGKGERVQEFLNEKYKREAKMERLEMRMKKWYNQPLIGYLIAFITLLFAFYQGYQNKNLEKEVSSLITQVVSLDKRHDSLNIHYRFLEKKLSDLKTEIE